jgi:hypothetical protein
MNRKILKSVHIGYGRFIMISIPKAAKEKRAVAVLHMRKLQAIGEFQKKMNLIRSDMDTNVATFPSPPVSVAVNGTFDINIKALDDAETLALTRAIGTATNRDIAREVVLDDAHLLQGYVQGLADALHNTLKAIALIELSGFDVSLREYHAKNDFTAKNMDISGTVKLAINVKKATGGDNIRYSVKWQKSEDEKEWDDLPGTIKGNTLVSGLIPATWMWFRFMVVMKDGEHGWSQAVKLLVT